MGWIFRSVNPVAGSTKPATRVRACALHQSFPWRPTKTAPYDGFSIFVGLVDHTWDCSAGLGLFIQLGALRKNTIQNKTVKRLNTVQRLKTYQTRVARLYSRLWNRYKKQKGTRGGNGPLRMPLYLCTRLPRYAKFN